MTNAKKFPLRFFILTFAWSWILWGLVILGTKGIVVPKIEAVTPAVMALMILGACGPAFGALVTVRTLGGKDSVKAFLARFIDFRFGAAGWLVPFLMLSLGTFIAWIAPEFFGLPRLAMLLPNIAIFPIYWLAMVFLGGGQEEIGWRGYIMPHMEDRFGFWKGTVLLGLIWALWHLPLWFIPGSSQTYMNFFGFIILTTGYSFLFSWGMKKSGNRPLAGLVMHGTANAFIPVFPTLVMQQGVAQPRFWLWVSLMLLGGIAVNLLFPATKKP